MCLAISWSPCSLVWPCDQSWRISCHLLWVSLMALMAKNLPAMQEIWVQSLGQEDPLEKGMATHSSILAWRIPWTKEPGRLQSKVLQRVRHKNRDHFQWVWSYPFQFYLFWRVDFQVSELNPQWEKKCIVIWDVKEVPYNTYLEHSDSKLRTWICFSSHYSPDLLS